MNMLTTVKTLADVRQVLRGYASPHPPEAEDYYDRRLAERAAAKAREEKEPIAQEAREAERATARHAVAGPNKPCRTKNSSAAYERRERLDDALLDFSPESKSARTTAEAVREVRAEFEARLATLEEYIKAPRPVCQSACLCRISASVGFGVDRATAGGS
jgi:hypothetical protein